MVPQFSESHYVQRKNKYEQLFLKLENLVATTAEMNPSPIIEKLITETTHTQKHAQVTRRSGLLYKIPKYRSSTVLTYTNITAAPRKEFGLYCIIREGHIRRKTLGLCTFIMLRWVEQYLSTCLHMVVVDRVPRSGRQCTYIPGLPELQLLQ